MRTTAIEQGRGAVLRLLRGIWKKYDVDNILLELRARLEKERLEQILPAASIPIYGLVETKASFGNPSLFTPIAISKPRIISSIQFNDSRRQFLSGSDQVESVPETSRAFVLGLNEVGFYARYGENRPKFLDRPNRIKNSSDLRVLLNDYLQSEKNKKPELNLLLRNRPRT